VVRANLLTKILAGVVGAAVFVGIGITAFTWFTMRGTERVEFDPSRGREALPPPAEQPEPREDSLDPDSSAFESFLILGSDERDGLGGARADVIMVALLPDDGSSPVLFSLPRDLWVHNACTGGNSRINAGLNGCGSEVSGPELMAIMVEDFTTIPMDHYVKVDFEGFTEVIDAVGGVRICNDHPIRHGSWELPGGCNTVGGDDALVWVRSRTTQEYVDGRWRTMPGVNDLTRNERQQEVMLQMVERLATVRSPATLHSLAGGVSESMALSRSLSIPRSVSIAWDARGMDRSDIRRFAIPVQGHVTSGGAQVLLPTEDFVTTFTRYVEDGEEYLDAADANG
jgi:LCP family protein required for cell wall assembly